MAEQDKRQLGPITDVRPNDDCLRDGKDHSVQSEAWGEEGSDNLANDGATSGGAAGRVDSLDTGDVRRRAEDSKR